jgi:hypothetical protein
MELDTSGFTCALDNPLLAGMQGLLFINGLFFLISLFLILHRFVSHRATLPSWCSAYAVAALSVHSFWLLSSLFVVFMVAGSPYEDVFSYLVSPEFLLVAAPSLFGLLLALRIRRHGAPDWAPSLALRPSATPSGPHPAPRA